LKNPYFGCASRPNLACVIKLATKCKPLRGLRKRNSAWTHKPAWLTENNYLRAKKPISDFKNTHVTVNMVPEAVGHAKPRGPQRSSAFRARAVQTDYRHTTHHQATKLPKLAGASHLGFYLLNSWEWASHLVAYEN
jgi:hypothetical protein